MLLKKLFLIYRNRLTNLNIFNDLKKKKNVHLHSKEHI